ncbi:hypothetical protein [Sandarakinorhabdus sp.]|uniref:hypothetical protein n=1 Tax=Sandarakinorhabdus sp. TaxID=1916663 RepID=UPI00286D76C1|nr:hypothetical protein [Sandarakinorhabdus sp.]
MRIHPALLVAPALLLAACGSEPEVRSSAGEQATADKAVADVDAAMAEAQAAK